MEKTVSSKKIWLVVISLVIALLAVSVAGMTISRVSEKSNAANSDWKTICPPREVTVFAEQGDIMWAGGMDGVYKLDRVNKKYTEELGSFSHVKGLLVDDDGCLWIGHEKGITILKGASSKSLTIANGLPDNHVTSLFQDRQGRVWAGTWKGAAVFDGFSWEVINSGNGLLDDMVNVVSGDTYGGIWLGSYVAPRGGLTYLQEKNRQYFSTDNGIPHNNINSIIQANDGTIWIGTGYLDRGGAVNLKADSDQTWRVNEIIDEDRGLPGAKVRSIYQDKSGVVWFGMEYDGLACRKDGRWQVLTKEDGLSGNEIKTMLEDSSGNFWLGTENGVTVIPGTRITLSKEGGGQK
ncbi:ligand-binding sensor domain-containing protein [Phosphitispora sp. TUW77]|uniref:ligand-binding sensor domain-containing protein n=1 Tax=Phosphitispora sp. TUW77 TaxID=3152361 RepID=UPI003AB166A6